MEEETIYFTYPDGNPGQSHIQRFEGTIVSITNSPYENDMETLKPGYTLITEGHYNQLVSERTEAARQEEEERQQAQDQVRAKLAADKEAAVTFLVGLGMTEDSARSLTY